MVSPNISGIRACVFDAYGTLFDFEGELRTHAVRDILEVAGASQHCPQAFAEAWGVQFFARYEQFGRDAGEGPEFVTLADLTADALAATSDGTPAAPRSQSIALPRTSVAETEGDSDPYEDSASATSPRSPIP